MSAIAPYLGEKYHFTTYAELANLPANMTSESYEAWNLDEKLHSECMYRVCCLIAFGANQACFDDVKDFVSLGRIVEEPDPNDYYFDPLKQYAPYYSIGINVLLPYSYDFINEWEDRFLIQGTHFPSTPQNNSKESPFDSLVSVRPIDQTTDSKVIVVQCAVKHSKINNESLNTILEQIDLDCALREVIGSLGWIIANAFSRHVMQGYFNGQPMLEVKTKIDAAWADLILLKQKHFPAICPVCGKVVDRRQPKGGRLPNTCRPQPGQDHGRTFQNEKTRLAKSDPTLFRKDLITLEARKLRHRKGTTERHLTHAESLFTTLQ